MPASDPATDPVDQLIDLAAMTRDSLDAGYMGLRVVANGTLRVVDPRRRDRIVSSVRKVNTRRSARQLARGQRGGILTTSVLGGEPIVDGFDTAPTSAHRMAAVASSPARSPRIMPPPCM